MYPAIMVVSKSIPARMSDVGNVATSIPSEKGKLIGCNAKYGLIKKKISIIPKIIPKPAYIQD